MVMEMSENLELVIDTALKEVGAFDWTSQRISFAFSGSSKACVSPEDSYFYTQDRGTSTCQYCSDYGPQSHGHHWQYLSYPIHY